MEMAAFVVEIHRDASWERGGVKDLEHNPSSLETLDNALKSPLGSGHKVRRATDNHIHQYHGMRLLRMDISLPVTPACITLVASHHATNTRA